MSLDDLRDQPTPSSHNLANANNQPIDCARDHPLDNLTYNEILLCQFIRPNDSLREERLSIVTTIDISGKYATSVRQSTYRVTHS